jgi:hypothetical protein
METDFTEDNEDNKEKFLTTDGHRWTRILGTARSESDALPGTDNNNNNKAEI